jgi:membrane-associated protease RseP (regulator of RpoE activity)
METGWRNIRKLIYGAVAVALLLSGSSFAQTPPAPATPATPAPPAHPRRVHRTMVLNDSAHEPVLAGGSYLGVDISNISPDRVSALRLPDDSGVEVIVVDRDSPAGKAGLREHDVIRTFNGNRVESGAALRRMIHETPAGHKVSLGIVRNGQPMSLSVQLADRHTVMAVPPMVHVEIPRITIRDMPMIVGAVPGSRLGVVVESLTPQLREYFGVPSGQGLLVRSVDKASPAQAAGLRAGDVIVRIQNEAINDLGDFRMAVRDNSGSMNVTIVRDKREQTVTVKLPEQPSDDESALRIEVPTVDIDAITDEYERLQPQIAQLTSDAMQTAMRQAQRAMELKRDEIEKAIKKAQAELERELKREQEELKKQQPKQEL